VNNPISNLTQIPNLPFPDVLPAAFGYESESRYFYVYWMPAGDEFRVGDETMEGDGNWHAWLAYRDHPAVYGHLSKYDFGSSDTEAKHQLVFDREAKAVYAGTLHEVQQFFVELRGEKEPREEMEASVHWTDEQWQEMIANLADAFRQIPPLDMAEIQARMEHEWQLEEQMVDALSTLPRYCYLCGRQLEPDTDAYSVGVHMDGCPA